MRCCHTAIAYLYSVPIKDLMEFICFREVLFYQVKEGLTNTRFNICRIRWIIPFFYFIFFFIAACFFQEYFLYLCQTITSICKVQKIRNGIKQTITKTTSYSRHFFLIRNKTAKITYFISERWNTLRVKLYLTCYSCYIVHNFFFINNVTLHRPSL